MVTSVSLAYMSSSGDRSLRDKVAAEKKSKGTEGAPRVKPPKLENKAPEKPASSAP
jgi:hypothetical protein